MTEFHWGATPESDAFFQRHPELPKAIDHLMVLANKTFGREYQPNSRLQDIGFNLGETCRTDFMEIAFIAVHGFGFGATKLLRGFYERAVALAYMIKYPEKAERFVRYAAIQEYKVMRAALDLVSVEEFNEAMGGKTTVAQMTEMRDKYKGEFEVPVCKKCAKNGTCTHTETAFSWDPNGVQGQAKALGAEYSNLYMGSYAIPNMHAHASLTSAMQEELKEPKQERDTQRHQAGDFALMSAHAVFLLVIRSQNTLFRLGLEEDLLACENEFVAVWGPKDERSKAS